MSQFVIFDDLHLQIIKSKSSKASAENSSPQWAIFSTKYLTIYLILEKPLSGLCLRWLHCKG